MSIDFMKTISGNKVAITRRGIAALVTYSDQRSGADYSTKSKYVWPDTMRSDSKYISRRVYGQGSRAL